VIRALLVLLALILSGTAQAHEIKPALLQINGIDVSPATTPSPTVYQVRWRAPTRYDTPLPVRPVFPADCTASGTTRTRTDSATVDSFNLECAEPLTARELGFDGLRATPTDVLVTYRPYGSNAITLRATARAPTLILPAKDDVFSTARQYFALGLEHILEGLDHLAFVLALLLLIGSGIQLIKAITAFTLAHSLTLAAVSLGFAGLPSRPVEILIAFSIALLAAEVIRAYSPDSTRTLTRRKPWLAAFAFGLLHGFGFAGALSEIGLPQGQIVPALLAFNVGIEAGQLLFVAAASVVLWALGTFRIRTQASRVAAYVVGAVAMSWTLSRLIGI